MNNDYVLTGISKTGNCLGFFTDITKTLGICSNLHNLNNVSKSILSYAISAVSLLMGSLKNKNDSIILLFNCTGSVNQIFVEANYEGEIRGYIEPAIIEFIDGSLDGGYFSTSPYIVGGKLEVFRNSKVFKRPYHSVIELQTGEISNDMSQFLDTSLQVQSIISLALSTDDKLNPIKAGGLLLMAMPGADDKEVEELYDQFTLSTPVNQILQIDKKNAENFFSTLDMELINSKNIIFSCSCNKEKVILSLLSAKETEDLLDEKGNYSVCCQYCNKQYNINPEELESYR